MEKKVMVIPNDDNELNDFIEEIWDRVNQDTARDFIRSKALPGPLLASFGVEVGHVFGHYTEDPQRERTEVKIIAIPDSIEGEQIEIGKKYHVLILDGGKK